MVGAGPRNPRPRVGMKSIDGGVHGLSSLATVELGTTFKKGKELPPPHPHLPSLLPVFTRTPQRIRR